MVHSLSKCLLLIIVTSSVYSHLAHIFSDFFNVWLIPFYLLKLCGEGEMNLEEFNLESVQCVARKENRLVQCLSPIGLSLLRLLNIYIYDAENGHMDD